MKRGVALGGKDTTIADICKQRLQSIVSSSFNAAAFLRVASRMSDDSLYMRRTGRRTEQLRGLRRGCVDLRK